jgi:hypothetical protein
MVQRKDCLIDIAERSRAIGCIEHEIASGADVDRAVARRRGSCYRRTDDSRVHT